MKKVCFTLLVTFSSLFAICQEWVTDFDLAKKQAHDENKKIILVFQGSDWCAPCMKLEKEIWSSEAFINHAATNFVMLQADFPRKKANKLSKDQQEKNNSLAEKYNPKGFFPFVVVLNKDGNILGNTGYKKMSPKDYISHLESFKSEN